MIKYIKYLFFLILFLSFSKGVHADSLGCEFTLFYVYNDETSSYDDWHLNSSYNVRDGEDGAIASAIVEKSGSNCISFFNMNANYFNNNFYGYVIGFYYNNQGNRIFTSPGEEKVFKLFLSNIYYNTLSSGYFKIDVYDTATITSKRTQLKYKYTDYCKSNNNHIGNYDFTIECSFPYTFTQDSYLTFYPTNTPFTLVNTGLAYRIETNYDNINDSINNMTDKITQGQDKTNQKLDDINNSITNDTPISVDKLGNTAGWLPAGPVDSILNLPLSLMNSLSTSLNTQCSPLQINVPYINTQVQIPCLSTIFGQIEGLPNFWSWVGAIASCLILYKYLLNLYSWVDNVLMLRLEMHEDFGGNSTNFGSV